MGEGFSAAAVLVAVLERGELRRYCYEPRTGLKPARSRRRRACWSSSSRRQGSWSFSRAARSRWARRARIASRRGSERQSSASVSPPRRMRGARGRTRAYGRTLRLRVPAGGPRDSSRGADAFVSMRTSLSAAGTGRPSVENRTSSAEDETVREVAVGLRPAVAVRERLRTKRERPDTNPNLTPSPREYKAALSRSHTRSRRSRFGRSWPSPPLDRDRLSLRRNGPVQGGTRANRQEHGPRSRQRAATRGDDG
jgi:hypothetical protein